TRHRVGASASYVNWVGRTVVQAREEAQLRELLREALPRVSAGEPQAMFGELRRAVGTQASLTPIPPTPRAWRNRNLLHFLAPVVVAALLLTFLPFVTILVAAIALILVAVELRRHELTDPIVENAYDAEWVKKLRFTEDHDVTNQYTA